MNQLSNFLFNNNRPQSQQRPIDPSMRGGLPKILDMLKTAPSYLYNRKDLEAGNKVLLPQEILHQLTQLYDGNLPHPLVFSVSTLRSKMTVYVGVLEFVAPEHTVILPFWLFRELKLNEGEMIRLGIADFLPKANFAKIRPHKTEFIDLPDPRAILEIHLRNFVCLTKDETITLNFMNKDYQLDILEIRPENQYKTGIIIDTDLSIDFASPLDYVEPQKISRTVSNQSDTNQQTTGIFKGQAMRMDGREIKKEQLKETKKVYDPREHKILHGIRNEWYQDKKFTGKSQRIGQVNLNQSSYYIYYK